MILRAVRAARRDMPPRLFAIVTLDTLLPARCRHCRLFHGHYGLMMTPALREARCQFMLCATLLRLAVLALFCLRHALR